MSKEVSFWAPSIIFVDILPRNYDLARSEQYFSCNTPYLDNFRNKLDKFENLRRKVGSQGYFQLEIRPT